MHGLKWVFVALIGLTASASFACGNVVRLSESEEVRGLTKAETHATKGEYIKAMLALRELYPNGVSIDGLMKRNSASKTLTRHARSIAAMAIVRTRGVRVFYRPDLVQTDRSTIVDNITWARDHLQKALARSPDDPRLKGLIAEAHALLGWRKTARKMFEALAKDDLLVDAESWAALARLRGKMGDDASAKAAWSRCAAIAPEAEFCRPKT